MTALIALVAAGAAVAPLSGLAAQGAPTGVWNVRSHDMTDRATGGVRVVLLRVQEAERGYAAEITSIRNTFTAVDEFTYERGTMHVVFGDYTYTLRVDGEDLTGTVVSPLGTQQAEGFRQHRTLMYVGDQAEEFETVRTGLLGDRNGVIPPEGEPDRAGWMRSRIASVEDLALLAGNRVRVPVSFTNARDFERQLLALAGSRVTIQATWVGERLRLESVEPATP
ncbi:MAG: hypothetical protein ABL963_01475 [Longimicrobiales bacterium]